MSNVVKAVTLFDNLRRLWYILCMAIPYFYRDELKHFQLIYDALCENVRHVATYNWAVRGLFLCRNELWNAYKDMFYRRNKSWLECEKSSAEVLLCAFLAEDYIVSSYLGCSSHCLFEAFGRGVDFEYLSNHENRKKLLIPNGLDSLSVYAEKVFANTNSLLAGCAYASATLPFSLPDNLFDYIASVGKSDGLTLLGLFTSVFTMNHFQALDVICDYVIF